MSELKTKKDILAEFKGKAIQRTGNGQPASWNDLPMELKTMVVKKMVIPTRLTFRQTARFERNLVDSEGLRAYYIHFDDERIDLCPDNGQQLMLRYKNEKNKFLPFLVYLFKVLVIDRLLVVPESRWYFEKICAQLPGGRASIKANFYQESYSEPTFKDKMKAGVRRLTRSVIGIKDPTFDPVYQLIETWVSQPMISPNVECLVFDRNPKPMWELLDVDFENKKPNRFYSPDLKGYEVGRIRLWINPKYHIYCYKKHGSHWMYMMMIEGSQHENEIIKEDKWSNYLAMDEKLDIKTHDEVCRELCEQDPGRADVYIANCEKMKEMYPQWR